MKRLALIIIIICGLIGLAIVTAPLIAATDVSKRRIASQIEEWTGHPVTFSGEPTVKLFPFLSLTIEDARIGPDDGDGKSFVVMDRLTCKLRLLQFLLGITEVAEFQLVRPEFRFTVDADGSANWIPEAGLVAAGAPATPHHIAEIKLGRFKIIDGTIIYDNRRERRFDKLDQVSLNLRWPEVSEPVFGTGAFTWRDEVVEFNASLSDPLSLIAGKASPARFGLASKPLRVSFTGNANGLSDLQLEGETTVTTPSVRRAVEWLGFPMDNGAILGAGLIEGDLNWIGPSLTFPAARLELDGNVADGSLSIDLSDRTPRVRGTLALEKLDLSAYLESVQAVINLDSGWQTTPVGTTLLDVADLDIRLSAGQILIGSLRMGKTAASVTVNAGKLDLNIGESQFYGGALSAEVSAEDSEPLATVSARIAVNDAPAAVALGDLAGIDIVDGTASADMVLDAEGETWGDLLASLQGSADVTVVDGALVGFELGQLAALSGGYGVADPAAGTGTVPFKSLSATLAFSDGIISSDNLVAEGETFALDLDGAVSISDFGVRGRGVLKAERTNAAAEGRRDIPFVVSGSWRAPFLLPDYERLIRRGAEHDETNAPVGAAPQRTPPNG